MVAFYRGRKALREKGAQFYLEKGTLAASELLLSIYGSIVFCLNRLNYVNINEDHPVLRIPAATNFSIFSAKLLLDIILLIELGSLSKSDRAFLTSGV